MKDREKLWEAYSALCHVLHTHPEERPAILPALNILLACLRAIGEPVGEDYR